MFFEIWVTLKLRRAHLRRSLRAHFVAVTENLPLGLTLTNYRKLVRLEGKLAFYKNENFLIKNRIN